MAGRVIPALGVAYVVTDEVQGRSVLFEFDWSTAQTEAA